jgi:hypothetical protein
MDCCAPSNDTRVAKTECPSCDEKGKNVQLITLKSLLRASALKSMKPENFYVFCSNPTCSTVYFSGDHSQTFAESDLKVPVYQKNLSMDVPVCYCFDWTRECLLQTGSIDQQPADQIKAHIHAGRCGCEVNNPQGACCLGNVNAFVSLHI